MHIVGINTYSKIGSTLTPPLFDAWNSYKHVQLKCRPQTVRDRVHVRPRATVRPSVHFEFITHSAAGEETERESESQSPQSLVTSQFKVTTMASLAWEKERGVLTLLNSSHNFTPISPGQCLPPLSLFLDQGLLLLY